jgi:hypothetical protein
MAYPDDAAPDPLLWFKNQLISAALIQANITDLFNALRALPRGSLGQAVDGTNSRTLATSGQAYAGFAPVTFTTPGAVGSGNRTIRIAGQVRFIQTNTTNARFTAQAGYNSGASATIGSFVGVGQDYNAATAVSGVNGAVVAFPQGEAVLAAGTQYTAYLSLIRLANGSATDGAAQYYTVVTDMGAA